MDAQLEQSSRSHSHVDIALPSAGTDYEGARALLRERIVLWTFWVFLLSSGFYVANLLTWPLLLPESGSFLTTALAPGALLHLAASLLFGVVTLMARRRRPSYRALRWIEAGTLIGGCALYSLMGLYLVRLYGTGPQMAIGLFAGLLASANVVAGRAIFVPSTPSRTFWLSTVAMLPLLPDTYLATGSMASMINVACWCGVTIAIATVGSQVIFGLRVEAARVRRLGQYTIEKKIGAGGMGVVYRARHAMLRRPTAIKLLPPDRAGEANLQRFEREVQLTAQLSHPNTVAIYDYGRTPDGLFYYAMEYLEGLTLEQLVRRDGPQPPGRVIDILSQICGALAEAHAHGLLHRDIKPANVILTERGGEYDVAKVVDFGLVKRFETSTPDVTVSASIVLAGTPLYMPPEALTSPEGGDPRSDLYAVGAVGYYLLTGVPVFEAGSAAEVLAHHLHTTPVPPSQRTARPIPRDLEDIILRCLQKDKNDRPADARTMQHELSRCAAAGSWRREDAAGWWRRFRESDAASSSESVSVAPVDAEAVTVTVDLASRLPVSGS